MILAMDLEQTLIATIDHPEARPGLMDFLIWARQAFQELVVFSAVPEDEFHTVATGLVDRGFAPAWFPDLRFLQAEASEAHEPIKDLSRIDPDLANVLLLDDCADVTLKPQRGHVVVIEEFWGDKSFWAGLFTAAGCGDGPDAAPDRELERIRAELERRLAA